ncbi:MAG: transposase [Microthrixaceae bacterium]
MAGGEQRVFGRVADEALARVDLFEGLRAIVIDEVKYKKGQRYLTIVSNHATGRVIWAKKGRNKKVVESFFAGLGAERAALLEIVTCDGAAWIHDVVKVEAPSETWDICLDTFHVVSLGHQGARRGSS